MKSMKNVVRKQNLGMLYHDHNAIKLLLMLGYAAN